MSTAIKWELQLAITERHPKVRVILSQNNVGPGGGRNKLIQAAQHEFVASLR